MKVFFALAFSLMLLLPFQSVAHADIEEGSYEIQGWCFDHMDPVFPDALGGDHNSEAVTNARPHMHMEWLVKDGFIPSAEYMVGKCAVLFSAWVRDENGALHQMAYVPKTESGLQIVSRHEALNFTDSIVDQYIEDMDVENARRKGLGSSGSTPTHQGHRRGAE